jgi:two-component system sensor kinase FixL
VSWTLVIWSMLASACLTLAAIHLLVWLRNRSALPSLFFSVMCVGTASLALCEASLMQARTPQEYALLVRWLHVPLLLVLTSLVGFVYVYLEAGRLWLAWSVIALRVLSLVLNFSMGDSVSFRAISELRQFEFLGEVVSVARGQPNPWMAIGQLSVWLCVVYIADASVTAWRRGDRAKALGVGLSSAFFLGASAVQALLIVWVGIEMPVTNSLFCLGVVAIMAYASSRHLLGAQQLAAELGESEQRMVLAAGAANLGIWSRDLMLDETWASSQWRSLFGFTATEPVSPERLLQKVHPDDRSRLRRTLFEPPEPPGAYQTEFRVLLPDGGVRWIASQGQAEFDAQGRPVRMRGASMDCTERKKNEQETLLLRQEIAHVGRVSVVGQLAAALAHEINQPLGAILRNAEAASLFLRQEPPDLDEVRAILDDIRKDDQRAGAVIDRMRSLLRRQTVDMRPLAVDELCGEVAALLRPEAVARHVTLDLDIGRDLPRVAGDRIHLQQVLINLVSNGMDAIDESQSPDRRSIVVSAKRSGAQSVEIGVSDSGRGLAANDFGRIFEPFYTTKAKGMGMGLSISRSIIEAHGGALSAENHHGGGARFLFTVPAALEGEAR